MIQLLRAEEVKKAFDLNREQNKKFRLYASPKLSELDKSMLFAGLSAILAIDNSEQSGLVVDFGVAKTPEIIRVDLAPRSSPPLHFFKETASFFAASAAD